MAQVACAHVHTVICVLACYLMQIGPTATTSSTQSDSRIEVANARKSSAPARLRAANLHAIHGL